MRTPGYTLPNDSLGIGDLVVDAYFPPRELAEGGPNLRATLAGLLRVFGKDVALPHLQRFSNRCLNEEIKLPGPPSKVYPVK